MNLNGRHIVLGITGSIAAYKIAGLASLLQKQGADITVIMTANATNFINPITFETLTGNKCLIDTFDRNFQYSVEHVALAKKAEVFLVAPASANFIAKAAMGIADDMLTTTFLACNCPKIIAPAMNTQMYLNPVTQRNLGMLSDLGMEIITPASGHLAGNRHSLRLSGEGPGPQRSHRSESGSQRRPYPGGNRSGALHNQPLFRQDGLCNCKSRRKARRRRHSSERPR